MNRRKWAAAAVLAGVCLLSGFMAGCGGEKKDAANEIRVGANFEITGNVANYGNAAFEGLSLAIDEINEAGGINGKKINLIKADSKSEPSESANAATKLVTDDEVKILVGPATTGSVMAEIQIATDNKVPIIAPCATNPKVTVEDGKVKPYVFRSCIIDPLQGSVMATFAAKTLSAKTAVCYVDASSDYSKSLAAVFKETFEAAGGKVLLEEAFLQKDTDFKATLTKIKAANPDVIFIPAYYEEVGKIVKQGRELGVTVPMLGTDGWDDTKVVDIAGAENLNGTYFCSHYSDTDAEVQPFIEAFKKKYDRAPNVFAALGYDAGKMLIDAITRGGEDTEKIAEALASIKDLKAGTGKITMDENHNPIKSVVILEMKNGEKTLKEKLMPGA